MRDLFALLFAVLAHCGARRIVDLDLGNQFLAFGSFDHELRLELRSQQIVGVVTDFRADLSAHFERELAELGVDVLVLFGHLANDWCEESGREFDDDRVVDQLGEAFDPVEDGRSLLILIEYDYVFWMGFYNINYLPIQYCVAPWQPLHGRRTAFSG